MVKNRIFRSAKTYFTTIISKCFISKQNVTYVVLSLLGKRIGLPEHLEIFYFRTNCLILKERSRKDYTIVIRLYIKKYLGFWSSKSINVRFSCCFKPATLFSAISCTFLGALCKEWWGLCVFSFFLGHF